MSPNLRNSLVGLLLPVQLPLSCGRVWKPPFPVGLRAPPRMRPLSSRCTVMAFIIAQLQGWRGEVAGDGKESPACVHQRGGAG
nr:MAG TPA: hypothetical protein [Caudoviricetes sp.]